jgi:hypothetical protein
MPRALQVVVDIDASAQAMLRLATDVLDINRMRANRVRVAALHV